MPLLFFFWTSPSLVPSPYSCHSLLQGSSQPRDWTWVSHTASRFFIVWATGEALINKHMIIDSPVINKHLIKRRQPPEFTQTHVHWVSDGFQSSHPLSSPSPPALNLSQHQGLFHFPVSQLFASGGQNIGISGSTSVLPMNTQDWFPLGWISWISLQSKGLSRVFSNTTVQKHQFFGAQLSL